MHKVMYMYTFYFFLYTVMVTKIDTLEILTKVALLFIKEFKCINVYRSSYKFDQSFIVLRLMY